MSGFQPSLPGVEPGLAAFNHPDADILHAGPGYSGYYAEPRNALASVSLRQALRSYDHPLLVRLEQQARRQGRRVAAALARARGVER